MAFLLSLDGLRGGLFRTREKQGRNPLAAVTVYTLSKFCLAIFRGRNMAGFVEGGKSII
jgi:hypothetical protein